MDTFTKQRRMAQACRYILESINEAGNGTGPENWHGITGAKLVDRGQNANPVILYNGIELDYYDVERAVRTDYWEDYVDDPQDSEAFDKWFESPESTKEVKFALDDLTADPFNGEDVFIGMTQSGVDDDALYEDDYWRWENDANSENFSPESDIFKLTDSGKREFSNWLDWRADYKSRNPHYTGKPKSPLQEYYSLTDPESGFSEQVR